MDFLAGVWYYVINKFIIGKYVAYRKNDKIKTKHTRLIEENENLKNKYVNMKIENENLKTKYSSIKEWYQTTILHSGGPSLSKVGGESFKVINVEKMDAPPILKQDLPK